MKVTAFCRKWEESISKPRKGIMRKQALAEEGLEHNHHLDNHMLILMQEEEGSSEA